MKTKKTIMDDKTREKYNLPSKKDVPCTRYGTGKSPTEKDILKGILWTLLSRFVRKRDGKCISCGKPFPFQKLQGGHYIPASVCKSMDMLFSEVNVNAECYGCNADFNGGHLIGMRRNLVEKYGEKTIRKMEDERFLVGKKWEAEDYLKRIHLLQRKLKEFDDLWD